MAVKEGHEEYLELAAIYALGALDGEDRPRFETHLASGCELCRKAIFDPEKMLTDLALAAPHAAPPASVRERLFERVRRDPEAGDQTRSGYSRFFMALAAAATLAAVGLGLYARTLHERAETERAAREALERDLGNFTATLDAFTAPATRAVSLSGQGDARGAVAKAFLDPQNRRLFLYVYNLPSPPPEGRTSSGSSSPALPSAWERSASSPTDEDGSTPSVPPFEGAVTVAVTVEPEGGVPQPTGPMVLVGS